jgi:hypothetical protein
MDTIFLAALYQYASEGTVPDEFDEHQLRRAFKRAKQEA